MFTVLGASGAIGRRLVDRLRSRGDFVLTPPRGDSQLFERPLGHVLYAIGLTADFRSKPFETVEAHVSVLADVLQRANFSSLLYLSSTRVYSGIPLGQENAELAVNPNNPSDLYNLSKLLGEALCLSCGRSNVRVARLSNVVGADDADSANFIPTLSRDARAGHIVLQTSLASAKDYIHIDDVVDLLPRIATHGQARLYNVASGVQIPHAHWVDRLTTLTGCRVDVAPDAPTLSFAPVDVSLIGNEFGFQPRSVLSVLTENNSAITSPTNPADEAA